MNAPSKPDQQQQQQQQQLPVQELVKKELGTFRNEVVALVRAVVQSTSGRGQPPPPAVLEAGAQRLLQSHAQVQRALTTVKEHLSFHQRVGEAQTKVDAAEAQLVKLNEELQAHEGGLRALTYEARQLMPAHLRKTFELKTSRHVPTLGSNRSDLNELVEFARNISYATAAPRGWHFSQAKEIPLPYKPPAPQSENMKMGLLFTEPRELLDLMSQANARQVAQQSREAAAAAAAAAHEARGGAVSSVGSTTANASTGAKRGADEVDRSAAADAQGDESVTKRKKKKRRTGDDDGTQAVTTATAITGTPGTGKPQFNLDIGSDSDED
jgi:hypothetical protein